MQTDFEPVLERQVHYFVNGASGVHIGQRDIALDPHQQGGGRQRIYALEPWQNPPRPLPRRVWRDRGRGAGQGHHRPGAATKMAGEGPRCPITSAPNERMGT